jgi:hypothetical protein
MMNFVNLLYLINISYQRKTKMSNFKGFEFFDSNFKRLLKEQPIRYSISWKDMDDYFSLAVQGQYSPDLLGGEMRACTDDKNRKMIFIGTPLGNIIIFQRYVDTEGIVLNAPEKIKKLLAGVIEAGYQTQESLYALIGNETSSYGFPNIGTRLSSLLEPATV